MIFVTRNLTSRVLVAYDGICTLPGNEEQGNAS